MPTLTLLSFLQLKRVHNKTSFPVYVDVPGNQLPRRERKHKSFLPYCASKERVKGVQPVIHVFVI